MAGTKKRGRGSSGQRRPELATRPPSAEPQPSATAAAVVRPTEWIVFAAATFLGAYGLFEIQPLMSKLLLPRYGGSAGVWATCLVFYQVLLLLGYAYGHVLSRLSLGRQVIVHAVVGAVAGGVLLWHELEWSLHLVPAADLPAAAHAPVSAILSHLTSGIGLPFFFLSSTGPLVQSWLARAQEVAPYRLYTISNLGSMTGLLAYPLMIEPGFALDRQAEGWVFTFFAAGALCLGAGLYALRLAKPEGRATAMPAEDLRPPSWRLFGLWAACAAAPSALLVATTTKITENVAAVPVLWVLPLSIYLLSFVITFAGERWYPRAVAQLILIGACFWAWVVVSPYGALLDAPALLLAFLGVLFVACWVCHGELVRLQPAPRHTTSFYLALAFGGAVGGMLAALAAPKLLPDYWEYQLSVFAVAGLALGITWRDPDARLHRARPWIGVALALAGVACATRLPLAWLWPDGPHIYMLGAVAVSGLIFTIGYGVATRGLVPEARYASTRWVVAGLVVLFGVGLVGTTRSEDTRVEARARDFYGVWTVEEAYLGDIATAVRRLRNGVTTHGLQLIDPGHRDEPASYYHTGSGIERAIATHPRRDEGLRIGVIGLGIGTLASFTREIDTIRFYEIDPLAADLARQHFTYLDHAKGQVEIVLGDARISLARELAAGPQRFDILVVDAFSGDSVPIHLMTNEAVTLYREHLRDETSFIAFNISNRFLDLELVLTGLARRQDLDARVLRMKRSDHGRRPNTWAVMASKGHRHPLEATDAYPLDSPKAPLWTDHYSNVIGVMRHWLRLGIPVRA